MYVYKITNTTNGKPYVGQTRKKIEKRFMEHFYAKTPLGEAMRQCGLENFTIEIIEECETREQAQERERFWIKVLKSKQPNGYNRSDGGEGGYRSRNVENTDSEKQNSLDAKKIVHGKYEYPAVFFPDGKSVGVKFYDADWYTCGEDIADAIEMAEDLLGGRLMRLERDGGEIPQASTLAEVKLLPDQVVRMIAADTEIYAQELAQMNDRAAIEKADNPIRELLNRRHMKIKEFADFLGAPYRTVQDWSLGKSRPPAWVLKLILDKIID